MLITGTGGDEFAYLIDFGSGTVTATIPVGNRPVAVAVSPDGHRAYITNGGSGTVSVIDIG